MSSCIWLPLLSYCGSVISACIGLRGSLLVNQCEFFFSSHSFMHYSNPSKKTVVSRNKRLFAVVSGLEARTTNGQYIDYLLSVEFNIAY